MPDDLVIDRMAAGAAADVVLLDGFAVGEGPVREPHRHDYHELVWVRAGAGEHRVDGRPVAVVPGTVTVIGRGQVHVFRWARDLRGAVVRFSGELVVGGPERVATGALLAGGGGRVVPVPEGAAGLLDAQVGALHAELTRPADPFSPDLQRNLVATLLLWLERWHDAARAERTGADDADAQLHRRFVAVLERDFAAHHDAAHYADALGVPAAALSRALARRTGHFSRAFKRHAGEPPQAFRDRVRGG
ncbi:MAG: AraC family ligand binding domain-containing protein [Solirubrobacterales bacterium]|nr:AraC family ligand binding domain-containing protein [Solirubrobacterales bacterium]